MNLDQFLTLARSYSAIPVYRRSLADLTTPVALFMRVRQGASLPFLFESVEGGEHVARYSFLGGNPFEILEHMHQGLFLTQTNTNTKEKLSESYFDALKRLTTRWVEPDLPDLPRLSGGAVGYSSYDTVREVESLPHPPKDELHVPQAVWAFYDALYAFDHVKHSIICIKTVLLQEGKSYSQAELEQLYVSAQRQLDDMQAVMEAELPVLDAIALHKHELKSNITEPQFFDMVEKAKRYIFEGDIFQVVLSQRFSMGYSGDRFQLYRALRMVNPSPYLFFIELGSFALIGSSPEVLVSVQNREVKVLPIAGTRPRGSTVEEDVAHEEALLADPKEMAEHIMLVDLGRNDVSRVCEAQTVRPVKQHTIERYSHVMHIVSDVRGTLRKELTSVDALAHCFPAGTVSGAPKVRAMQIIDELEPTRRGPYAGAVGYFDFSGNMDTCIAIRTMVATNDMVYVQAGAGIVADSDPQKEYQETVNKAKALIEAIRMSITLA